MHRTGDKSTQASVEHQGVPAYGTRLASQLGIPKILLAMHVLGDGYSASSQAELILHACLALTGLTSAGIDTALN